MEKPEPVLDTHLTPIYITTGIFGVIFILGLVAPRGPNAGIIRTSLSLSAFCMWLFWLIVYVSQINPILGPTLHNTSLIWISQKWGLELDRSFLRSRQRTEPSNDLGFDMEPTIASRIVVDDVSKPQTSIAPSDADFKAPTTVTNIPDEDIKPDLRRVGIESLPASEKITEVTEQTVSIDEEPKIRTLRPDIDLESSLIDDEERKRRANSGPDNSLLLTDKPKV